MEMTKADILRDWKEAKDKKNQVRVLAELNCTTQEHIVAILKEMGVDGRLLPRKRKPVVTEEAPPQEKDTPQVIPFPKEALRPKPRVIHDMERMAELFAAISKTDLANEGPDLEYVDEFDELWAKFYERWH